VHRAAYGLISMMFKPGRETPGFKDAARSLRRAQPGAVRCSHSRHPRSGSGAAHSAVCGDAASSGEIRGCAFKGLPGPGLLLRCSVPAGRGHDDLLFRAALAARLNGVDRRERVAQTDNSPRRSDGEVTTTATHYLHTHVIIVCR
jgi:hypothetical protein